jgi:transposase
MIEAVAPNGTNHPLDVGSLPRGARRRQHFADAHVSHLSSECIAEDGIAVAQQITRELVKEEGFPQLLSRPLRGRVSGHIEVKNTTTVMSQYEKHVKDLESGVGTVKKSIETNCLA